jgi:hypothetical protein
MDVWEGFPHVAITSPEPRSGKSNLLKVLSYLCPRPRLTVGMTPAALFRSVAADKPTVLYDEAQGLRRKSENETALHELMLPYENGAVVQRCELVGKIYSSKSYEVYCPKVFALIGRLDNVLADRCLHIRMRRRAPHDRAVNKFLARNYKPRCLETGALVKAWCEDKDNREMVRLYYDSVEQFELDNDRMADLLMPLQAVLLTTGQERALEILEEYARELEKSGSKPSFGIILLGACREIFGDRGFVPTVELIEALKARDDEPWHRWNGGTGINNESLAKMLLDYDIKPRRDSKGKIRGYRAASFADAWDRYLPPPGNPSGPSELSEDTDEVDT